MSWSCKYHRLASRLKVINVTLHGLYVREMISSLKAFRNVMPMILVHGCRIVRLGGKGKYSLNNQR